MLTQRLQSQETGSGAPETEHSGLRVEEVKGGSTADYDSSDGEGESSEGDGSQDDGELDVGDSEEVQALLRQLAEKEELLRSVKAEHAQLLQQSEALESMTLAAASVRDQLCKAQGSL